MTDKSEIRKYFKKLRDEMSPGEVKSLSRKICGNILASSLFREAGFIYAYAPLGNEADVMPVVNEALRQGKRVAFPKVFGEEMRYFEVTDLAQLVKGAFGVREPDAGASAVPADWRDKGVLVLVPGVAFDRSGVRMGFGKGYYDRYFADRSGFALMGAAYEGQFAESLPAEEYDLVAEYLATEAGIFHPGRPAKQAGLKEILKRETDANLSGGIYHRIQTDLTYNSNHMEGNRLTYDQVRYIYESNFIDLSEHAVNVDDVIETVNHFRCIDRMIADADRKLTEKWIKEIHGILKAGTGDSRKSWFAVGDYKKLPNEAGGRDAVSPEDVAEQMKKLLDKYHEASAKTLEELLQFHVDFERIHPFQDGNGRVGRIILFKECLRNDIVPFIITEGMKMYYYRGLAEWDREKGYLTDTCLAAQDRFKPVLDYFKIAYRI